MMKIKMMAEVDCKRRAIEMGIDIFVSVDMDEFVFPLSNHWTVVDELAHWFNTTTRGMVMLGKFQFPPTPHLLEPVNLLTIEAYQTRMRAEGKMNYYTSVVCLNLYVQDVLSVWVMLYRYGSIKVFNSSQSTSSYEFCSVASASFPLSAAIIAGSTPTEGEGSAPPVGW